MTSSSVELSADLAGNGRQVLTFDLAGEVYGVDILRVQEIRGWSPVTRIPKTPKHVLGVLNLRGSIVPIIDLRIRFGLERAEFTPLTVIIVLSIETDEGRREFGLVVDAVSDVVDLSTDAMRESPNLGSKTNGELIEGLATVDDRMLILLNVDQVVAVDLEARAANELKGAAA
jgi:purine-binding chemotaxis protein CheW